ADLVSAAQEVSTVLAAGIFGTTRKGEVSCAVRISGASDREADADQAMLSDAGAGLEHPALALTKRDRVVEPPLQAALYRSRHDERRSLPRQLGQTRQQRAAQIRAFPID